MSKYWNKQKLSFIIIHIGPCEVTDIKSRFTSTASDHRARRAVSIRECTGSRKREGFPGLDPFIPEVRLPELIIQLYHNPLKEGHK